MIDLILETIVCFGFGEKLIVMIASKISDILNYCGILFDYMKQCFSCIVFFFALTKERNDTTLTV